MLASNDPINLMKLGEMYQEIGIKTEESVLRNGFLNLSHSYLQKAKKHTNNPELSAKLIVLEAISFVYLGRYKKAVKVLDKVGSVGLPKRTEELKAFALAFCYKCQGKEEEFASYKEKVTDQAFLAKLEE